MGGCFCDDFCCVDALKSNVRANWMAYAIALHVAGSCDTATKVLDAFYGTLSPDREITYEDSELILYRAEVSTMTD